MNLQSIIPSGKHLVVATLWLCLAYTLSVGPAFYVARQTGRGRQGLHTFYAPLFWLHHQTALDTPLKWYTDKWEEGMADKAPPAVAQRRSAQSKPAASQQ
jgi:hypothetical protein